MDWTGLDTPIGELGVAVEDGAVVGVRFGGPPLRSRPAADERFTTAIGQLSAYFSGERTDFELPLTVLAGSDFERAVWKVIETIPYGETLSYGEIAKRVGEPGGAQAVGTACGRNPIPVIVPCHRVIGADGKLVGFGGGLHRKQWLLQHETKYWIEHQFGA